VLSRILTTIFGCVLGCSGAIFAIRDITVIDGSGGPVRPHSTVIVRGEHIASVGAAASTAIPKRAKIIDGRGRFMIPGLWDMHVHLWYPENQLTSYLAHGITGVRDMGSDFGRVVSWRKAIASGRAAGPHVVTSGPPIAGAPSGDPKLPVRVVRTPDEARNAVDELEESGVDLVKVLSDVPHDAYVALAERARHEGLDFAGHIPDRVTALEAVEARQASIEHLFGLFAACASDLVRSVDTFDEAKARALFERSAQLGIRYVPTLALFRRMTGDGAVGRVRDPRLREVPASIRSTWPKPDSELREAAAAHTEAAQRQFALAKRMVRMMRDCGVEILAGTGTGAPYTIPGVTLHEEMQLLVEAGLTPMEAIRSATILPAKLLGWADTVGLLRPGFAADFVLLDGNPLTDIRNTSRISGLSVRGRYFARDGIARLSGARTPAPK
jgi:imidazolonepropionase-like amidohydrolase